MGLGVRLANGIYFVFDNEGITEVVSAKARAVVSHIALTREHRVSRERLVGLLWSDRPEEQARASLRQSLKQLRNAFESVGFEGFHTDRQDVWFDAGTVVTDVEDALEQIADGRRQTLIDDDLLSAHRLMYGYESLDPAFGSWLYVIRETWRRRLGDALEALAQTAGDITVRKWANEVLVDMDPGHEPATYSLIHLLAQENNSTAALKVYARHWEILDQEFDTEPSQKLQALIADVKLGVFDHPQEPTEGAERSLEPAPRSLAAWEQPADTANRPPVLLVDVILSAQADATDLNFINVFRKELIASLVKFREWVVVDFPGWETAEPKGADEVNFRIEGVHMLTSEGHSITLNLIDSASRRYIWSEQFTLTLETWFDSLRRVVRRMAVGINTQLSTTLVRRRIVDPDVSPDAYDLWIRAHDLFWSWRIDARREAESMFRGVIRLSPRFAAAYSGLSSVYNTDHAISPGIFAAPDRIAEAETLARKAVELDPLDVRGRMALAWANAMAGQHDFAALQFDLAFELNPNNPTTVVSCANGKSLCGDLASAQEY
ncbi:MAG: hypothetical protein NXI03_10705, partial [Alphaproteobacteria bacterium]|nr:hypothetical protein [Alphaproteobacteria bacterium]